MKKLRVAVVGVGYLGNFHAQKYKLIPEVELVGVYDASSDRAKEIANLNSTSVISDLKDLVGKVDAVTVATSTSAHFEICEFLLKNKIHVQVEKPIAVNSTEGQKLCDLAKKNNLKLQVGHVERFNPALLAAHEKLKKPLFIECHRLAAFKPRGADVNVVLDLMIHDLDLILHLVQSKPKKIDAIGTPILTKAIDIANARIEFENGTVANVTASRVSLLPQRKFRIFQAAQYLSLDFGSGEVRLINKKNEIDANGMPAIETESWNLEKSDALLSETKSFVNSILNNAPCVVTGEDGVEALKLAEQIIYAIEHK